MIHLIPAEDMISYTTLSTDPIGTNISDLPNYIQDLEHDFATEFDQKIYNKSVKINESKKGCSSWHQKDNNYNVKAPFRQYCQLENCFEPDDVMFRIRKQFDIPVARYFCNSENDYTNGIFPYGNIEIEIIPHNDDTVKYKNDITETPQTRQDYDTIHKKFLNVKQKIRDDPYHKPGIAILGAKSIFIIKQLTDDEIEREFLTKINLHLSPVQIKYAISRIKCDIARDNEYLFKRLAIDRVCWDVTDEQLAYMKEKDYERFTAIDMKKKWEPRRMIACGVDTKDSGQIFGLNVGEKKLAKEEYLKLISEPVVYRLEYRDVKDESIRYAIDDLLKPGRLVNIREFVRIVEWREDNPYMNSWKRYFGKGKKSYKLLTMLKKEFLEKDNDKASNLK